MQIKLEVTQIWHYKIKIICMIYYVEKIFQVWVGVILDYDICHWFV